jgi:hypothetical protein
METSKQVLRCDHVGAGSVVVWNSYRDPTVKVQLSYANLHRKVWQFGELLSSAMGVSFISVRGAK